MASLYETSWNAQAYVKHIQERLDDIDRLQKRPADETPSVWLVLSRQYANLLQDTLGKLSIELKKDESDTTD